MVKLSPTQMIGNHVLPRLTTRKQNDFFNTVAHYRGRLIKRRMEFNGAGARLVPSSVDAFIVWQPLRLPMRSGELSRLALI
jgi:hypothetical protein